ncbi:MAG: hypothetical protein IV097_05335 [Burkholderiaceae bacterium]|nr:hypothetical protein [Burkholderiaceae bacterium]
MSRTIQVRRLMLFLVLLVMAAACRAQLPPGTNVFFLDLDQDSYGDPNQPYLFYGKVPPSRMFVPWGNDPDDLNPMVFPLPRPQGARLIAQELNLLSAAGLPERLLAARELGAQSLFVALRWSELEPGGSGYSAPLLQALGALSQALPGTGIKLVLSLDLVDGNVLTLPADLKAAVEADVAALGSAATVARAAAALARIKTALGPQTVLALRLGNEVDRYLPGQGAPAFGAAYVQLLRQLRPQARAVWGPSLALGVSGSLLGSLQEPGRSLMQTLQQEGDWVMARFAPAEAGVLDPRGIRMMVEYLIAAAGGKPLALLPMAYASDETLGSSEVLQSQFLRAFFDTWDAYADQIPLVAVSALDDAADGALSPAQRSYGFRNADRSVRASYGALRHLSFDRGWWALPMPASRKFHMGFTTTPYDTPDDAAGQGEVARYVDDKLAQHGDLVALHMDGGVPWMEALLDPFQTYDPPYPGSVLGTWRNYRARLQPGKKLLVSINPLGIPRELLAPLWGYGEGFSYTSDFQRVPNGIWHDGERRLPPPPFDKLSFDATEVKWAYLKYAIRALDYFKPDYLCFAIEVSATDVASAEAFQRYVELHRFVFEQLKKLPAAQNTKLFVSFSATSFMTDEFGHLIGPPYDEGGSPYKYDEMAPGIRQRLKEGVQSLLPYLDLVGLSYYPHYGKYNAYTLNPAALTSMHRFLLEAGVPDSMPLAVTESGYPADPYLIEGTLFAASADKQQRHLELMFYELSKLPNPVEFVVNYAVRDIDLHWQRLVEEAENPRFVEFYKYFRDLGLYDGAGVARPSLDTWTRYFQLPLVPSPVP